MAKSGEGRRGTVSARESGWGRCPGRVPGRARASRRGPRCRGRVPRAVQVISTVKAYSAARREARDYSPRETAMKRRLLGLLCALALLSLSLAAGAGGPEKKPAGRDRGPVKLTEAG